MDEKRYSLRTAGEVIGVSQMVIANRAKQLGISATYGLTAKDVKAIRDYKPLTKQARKGSPEALMCELEVLDGK